MEKLVVTDVVEGSDLERVECGISAITLAISNDSVPEQNVVVRFLEPAEIDGKPFGAWVVARISALMEETEDDDERHFYAEVLMLLGIGRLPALDRKRRRRFDLHTLDTSETLKELARTTNSEGHPRRERLVRFAGHSSSSSCRLLNEALYVRPNLVLPLAEKHYCEFRDQFIREMADIADKLNEIQTSALRDLEAKIELRQDWTPERKKKALARLREMRDESDSPTLNAGWQKAIRLVFRKAVEMENEGSERFVDLVRQARQLQEPVAREVEQHGMQMLEEDGETFTAEYADCIARHFDVESANCLLEAAAQRYEEVFAIPRGELVSLSHWPSNEPATPPDVAITEDGETDLPVEWQQYAAFLHSRDSDDLFDKWYTVGWLTTNLVNRTECVRLLQREAEGVFEGVLDYGFRLVYSKIRHRLTPLERRVFKLMYFRQPLFAAHVAALNPVISSFFTGMDDDTQLLILLVLVLRHHESDGRKDLDKELERRWRAYLRFYPYWSEIVRADDRESKRERAIRSKTLSLDRPLGTSDDGRQLTGAAVQADHRNPHATLLEALVASAEPTLAHWARRYCTETQARHLLRVASGDTETTIAAEEGITQPAVSKNVKAALQRIRRGLVRDGVLPEGS